MSLRDKVRRELLQFEANGENPADVADRILALLRDEGYLKEQPNAADD